jgi:hypothetical protein
MAEMGYSIDRTTQAAAHREEEAMQRGLAREARRRPDLDLLAGPLEAAEPEPSNGTSTEPAELGPLATDGMEEIPTWREDG